MMNRMLVLLVVGSLGIFGCSDSENPTESSEDLLGANLLVDLFGTWSHTNGELGEIMFNADGNYVDWDGSPGTWSTNGDTLTTIVNDESIDWTFAVNGDDLTLSLTGTLAVDSDNYLWQRKKQWKYESTILAEETIYCPYCGEMFDIFVDPSVAEQIYVEDCYVCCQPILLAVRVGMSGEISIEARQEND